MKSNKNQNPISVAKPHTVKKFELIAKYVDEWARKLLGYDKTQGIIFIDCMCNCGAYYDEQGDLIDGTALRIIKILNSLSYPEKKNSSLF